ncbi:MAG: CopD family protein [Gammaproteobacteria bacterium]|nr:CopD family protein [Gammaproteobacteria bacterium]MBU1491379.1 CopD family protein [Gammaproteobacteria bacterium]MBU2064784.1 CopD family protein [Gammaproteobacteria bacterium]MBU2139330.1 CopD family protein [Gammaproteobacteria bacterium]MBU2218695.1 CopD family protein [Gammaproteobacteria bacterium]
MPLYTPLYTLHLLAALIWVGGMFFAWMVLRPAAAALPAAERLRLWLGVFERFFRWVWAAVLILPISGVGLMHLRFNGFESAPRYVQIMIGLYLVMLALFLRIQILQLPELRRAVLIENWPAGAATLGSIRRLVAINLLIGLLLISVAGSRLSLG